MLAVGQQALQSRTASGKMDEDLLNEHKRSVEVRRATETSEQLAALRDTYNQRSGGPQPLQTQNFTDIGRIDTANLSGQMENASPHAAAYALANNGAKFGPHETPQASDMSLLTPLAQAQSVTVANNPHNTNTTPNTSFGPGVAPFTVPDAPAPSQRGSGDTTPMAPMPSMEQIPIRPPHASSSSEPSASTMFSGRATVSARGTGGLLQNRRTVPALNMAGIPRQMESYARTMGSPATISSSMGSSTARTPATTLTRRGTLSSPVMLSARGMSTNDLATMRRTNVVNPHITSAGGRAFLQAPQRDRGEVLYTPRAEHMLQDMKGLPTSINDLHYIDYTHNDETIHKHAISSQEVKEKLLERRGRSQVMMRWCGYCEAFANHRTRGWEVLTAIIQEFPDLDYMNALPSEVQQYHVRDVLHPEKHRFHPTRECEDICVMFKPRGQPLKSLRVTDTQTVLEALRKCVEDQPKTNVSVTLLDARNLVQKRFQSAPNPFVKLSLGGQTLESHYCERTTDPNFQHQLFTFRCDNPQSDRLKVEVVGYVSEKKARQLGTVEIPLSNLRTGEVNRASHSLDGVKSGTISLVLQAEGDPFPVSPNPVVFMTSGKRASPIGTGSPAKSKHSPTSDHTGSQTGHSPRDEASPQAQTVSRAAAYVMAEGENACPFDIPPSHQESPGVGGMGTGGIELDIQWQNAVYEDPFGATA